ncbi:hypothetical protein NC970_24390, partial [Pseudomonas aeruginosa]|nr:hypothetical protein [Pseudomonas aeruginosa]
GCARATATRCSSTPTWTLPSSLRLTSWRRGLLVFDEQPLGEVVARLNRYRPGHLLVAPGALAQRRVSGVFRVADLEASLQSISDELGVRSLGLAGVTLLY